MLIPIGPFKLGVIRYGNNKWVLVIRVNSNHYMAAVKYENQGVYIIVDGRDVIGNEASDIPKTRADIEELLK